MLRLENNPKLINIAKWTLQGCQCLVSLFCNLSFRTFEFAVVRSDLYHTCVRVVVMSSVGPSFCLLSVDLAVFLQASAYQNTYPATLKALYMFGKCQRPVISLGVFQLKA